jgi:hypothetical protein
VPGLHELDEAICGVEGQLHPLETTRTYVRLQPGETRGPRVAARPDTTRGRQARTARAAPLANLLRVAATRP